MAFMFQRKSTILVFLLMATVSATATADFGSWLHRQKMTYFRNSAWPDPFNEADALDTVAPFEIMKHNGWRSHNTIGNNLFRSEDGALLASGQNRIRWIATQCPEAHREIHVLEGRTAEETANRIESVRHAIKSLNQEGIQPRVFVTTIEPSTTPGAIATKINRDRLEQMAAPKLPTTTASGQAGVTQ